jgi:exopolysaccharide biosynthesis polyprenyl glycosylphosphotransferase
MARAAQRSQKAGRLAHERPPESAPPGQQPARWVGGAWIQVAYVLIDAACVTASSVLALILRFATSDLARFFSTGHLNFTALPPLPHYGGFLLLDTALVTLFCEQQDLYWTPRTRTTAQESAAVLKAVSYATLVLAAFLYLSGSKIVSRLVVAMSSALTGVVLIGWRAIKRRIVIRRVAQGIGARNALIIGGGKVGQALAQYFEANKSLGFRFVGFLDGNHWDDPMMRGRIEDLQQVARALFVDDLFITIPSEREVVKRIAAEARRANLTLKVVPDLYDGLGWSAPVGYIGHFPVMELHGRPIPALGLFFKRVLDVFLSATGLVVLAPVLGVIALAIRLDSLGPVLYRSRRVGKKGRKFMCHKFRTMVANADEIKDQIRHLNERDGPFFKIADDPRVTRLGRWLRKYSLDELPQLWNVLRGEMSLVGPRPHPLDDYKEYSLEHLRRLDVNPGLTGLWQVTARQDPSFETNMALDLEYIENWSLWLDTKILFRTLPAALRGDGQ